MKSFLGINRPRWKRMGAPATKAAAITFSSMFALWTYVPKYKEFLKDYSYWIPLFIGIVIFFWAWYRTHPEKLVMRKLPRGMKITVRVGNILDETSDLAFASNNYFETDVLLEPVRTLKSKMLHHFYKDMAKARQLIDAALYGATKHTPTGKQYGQQHYYDIGEVAMMNHPNSRSKVYLVALSELNIQKVNHQADKVHPHYSSFTTPLNLEKALNGLWKAASVAGSACIAMPIMGSGFARTGQDQFLLLQTIIISFVLRNKDLTIKELIIVLPEHKYNPAEMPLIDDFLQSINV